MNAATIINEVLMLHAGGRGAEDGTVSYFFFNYDEMTATMGGVKWLNEFFPLRN